MDREVVELLNATALTLGDVLTIAQCRSRWKKKKVQ
jgi:hypothetical protein